MFGMFLVQLDTQKKNILGNENSAMYSKWRRTSLLLTFTDVIRIGHYGLNNESTQPVAILTFDWTL